MKNHFFAILTNLILGSILLLIPQRAAAQISPFQIDCLWHPDDCKSLNDVSFQTFWGYLKSEVQKVGDQTTLECSGEDVRFGIYLKRNSASEVFAVPYFEADNTLIKVAQVTFTSDGKYIVHSQPREGHLNWFRGAGGAQEFMNGLKEYKAHGCPEDFNRS